MNEPELLERARNYLTANISPKRHRLIDDIIKATFRRIQTGADAYSGGDFDFWFYRVLGSTMMATIRAQS